MKITVKRTVPRNFSLERIAKLKAFPIIPSTVIAASFGFGPRQILPDGIRQPLAEANVLGDIVMIVNGLSGQLND